MLKIMFLLYRASFLLRPAFWLQNHPYSAEWDAALNRMLDKPVFERSGEYTVILNGRKIWISNWPYGYGNPYDWARPVMPRRATLVRLRKAHEAFLFGSAK